MLAADNLASYGSLARFKDVERLKQVGDFTVVGAGGDMSDFQHLEKTLEALVCVLPRRPSPCRLLCLEACASSLAEPPS